MARQSRKPRAWIDGHKGVCFRKDTTEAERRELEAMLIQAFNVGLVSGYAQGKQKARA